jgi:hypothetical protein
MNIAVVSKFENKKINQKRAIKYCKYVFSKGHYPFAAHLLYPLILDDPIIEQRNLGLSASKAFIKKCDEVWVFTKIGVPYSDGMLQEIEYAKQNDIPIKYFLVDSKDNIIEELNFDKQADSAVNLFNEIADKLKHGANYEKFNNQLDTLLETSLKERDLEAEEAFELENRIKE